METNDSPIFSSGTEPAHPARKRPGSKLRTFLLVIAFLTLAFAVFSIFGATMGTSDNSPYSERFLLTWITLPSFLLGFVYLALYFLVRRNQTR
jgi:ABC-type dipeptide/oligopeptide/nickel transport system permease component